MRVPRQSNPALPAALVAIGLLLVATADLPDTRPATGTTTSTPAAEINHAATWRHVPDTGADDAQAYRF